MKNLILMLCVMVPSALVAADSVAPVVEKPLIQGDWLQMLMTVVVIPLILVGIRYLNNKATKEKSDAEANKQSNKSFLRQEVTAALLRVTSNIAQKELLALKEATSDGKIEKSELVALATLAKDTVKTEFKQQGIDIAKEFSDEILDSIIRFIVDKTKKQD